MPASTKIEAYENEPDTNDNVSFKDIQNEADLYNEPIITHLKNTLKDKRKIYKCVYAYRKSDKKRALKAGEYFTVYANSESEARSIIEVICKSFKINISLNAIALSLVGAVGNINENQRLKDFDTSMVKIVKIITAENKRNI